MRGRSLLSFCRKVIRDVEPVRGPGGVAGGTWEKAGEQGGTHVSQRPQTRPGEGPSIISRPEMAG